MRIHIKPSLRQKAKRNVLLKKNLSNFTFEYIDNVFSLSIPHLSECFASYFCHSEHEIKDTTDSKRFASNRDFVLDIYTADGRLKKKNL